MHFSYTRWFGLVMVLSVVALRSPFCNAQEAPVESVDVSAPDQTPSGALWRALAVPGWGQIYNEQYVKLPFVYGAIGGMIYLAIEIGGKYKNYQRAYLYKAYQERVDAGIDETNVWSRHKSYYDEIADKFGQISSTPIRNQRDVYRRNRDLSILGAGVVYGLAILDAFVSAHLLDFDVGENLTLNMRPTPDGFSMRARIAIP